MTNQVILNSNKIPYITGSFPPVADFLTCNSICASNVGVIIAKVYVPVNVAIVSPNTTLFYIFINLICRFLSIIPVLKITTPFL